MKRAAINFNGQMSLPGVPRLPAKLARPRRKKRGGNAETALQRAILDWAALHPRELRLIRVQSGAALGLHGGFCRLAPEGTADLLGWAFGAGKFVAVEVKLPGKKPDPAQLEFLRDVHAAGGWAFVGRDVEIFAAQFRAAQRGEYAPPKEIA